MECLKQLYCDYHRKVEAVEMCLVNYTVCD